VIHIGFAKEASARDVWHRLGSPLRRLALQAEEKQFGKMLKHRWDAGVAKRQAAKALSEPKNPAAPGSKIDWIARSRVNSERSEREAKRLHWIATKVRENASGVTAVGLGALGAGGGMMLASGEE